MGSEVVEKVVGIVDSRFCGFQFIGCNGGKVHEVYHVYLAAAVQDAADFLLYRILLIIGGLGGSVFWVWFLPCFAVFAGGGGGIR